MTTDSTDSLNTALLVFARHLIDEMRYINYPKEWSRSPLKDLLPQFYDVLNHHPDKLGDIVRIAYERTFPEFQNGNVNQLGRGSTELTKEYELFGKTRQYYLDEYEIMDSYKSETVVEDVELTNKLQELFICIANTFAELTLEQENEHRTLERVCFALAPIYARAQGVEGMGRDLAEYADDWRNLSAKGRMSLKQELLSLH